MKCREDLAKKGYFLVFDFIAHTKEKADQRIHTEQLALAERVQEHEQVEDVLEESHGGLEDLMPKRVGQVRPKGCVDAHR